MAPTPAAPKRYQQYTNTSMDRDRRGPPALKFDDNVPMDDDDDLVAFTPPRDLLLLEPRSPDPKLHPATIEIARGVSVPLRGFSPETREYVARADITSHLCRSCGSNIYCIHDAEFILCPMCRVFEGIAEPHEGGGVALGFTEREWMEWKVNMDS
jgi:hypothetical protein